MTRIFGLNIKNEISEEKTNQLVQEFFQNMQEGLIAVLNSGWFSFGLGFIVVYEKEVVPVSIHRGYKGITKENNIKVLFENEISKNKKIKAIFGLIECEPDEGKETFESKNYSNLEDMFPDEAKDYYVMTMGFWDNEFLKNNETFTDSKLEWHDPEKQWHSLVNYLNLNQKPISFDWVSKERTPVIVVVKKDGSEILFIDKFSKNEPNGNYSEKIDNEDYTMYNGLKNSNGDRI